MFPHTDTSKKGTLLAKLSAKSAMVAAALALIGAGFAAAPSDARASGGCVVGSSYQRCHTFTEYGYSASAGWVYIETWKRYTLDVPTPWHLGNETWAYYYNTGRWVCIFTSSRGAGSSFC